MNERENFENWTLGEKTMRIRSAIFTWILACAIAFPIGCGSRKEVARPARSDTNRIVVMISVDGLANFYLDDPKAEMSVIRELARQGVRATEGMKAVVPTVTWPNHTTLVAGDFPAQHGVVGN